MACVHLLCQLSFEKTHISSYSHFYPFCFQTRQNFPELTEERRRDLVKQIKSTSENCKVVLRNARRDINDALKKMKKDSAISEDDWCQMRACHQLCFPPLSHCSPNLSKAFLLYQMAFQCTALTQTLITSFSLSIYK